MGYKYRIGEKVIFLCKGKAGPFIYDHDNDVITERYYNGYKRIYRIEGYGNNLVDESNIFRRKESASKWYVKLFKLLGL